MSWYLSYAACLVPIRKFTHKINSASLSSSCIQTSCIHHIKFPSHSSDIDTIYVTLESIIRYFHSKVIKRLLAVHNSALKLCSNPQNVDKLSMNKLFSNTLQIRNEQYTVLITFLTHYSWKYIIAIRQALGRENWVNSCNFWNKLPLASTINII